MPALEIEYLVSAGRQVNRSTHPLDDVIAYQNRGIPQLLACAIHRYQSMNVLEEQRGH
jgi:hypothetical protein